MGNAASVIANVVRHLHMNPILSICVQATDAPALPVWRRPQAGDAIDLKKKMSGAASSAASDTGRSASDTEQSELETLSSRAGETLSELDTGGETLSEIETGDETASGLDSDAGDVDQKKNTKTDRNDMPLLKGLGKRKRAGAKGDPVAKETGGNAKESGGGMAPPVKKIKKAKAA